VPAQPLPPTGRETGIDVGLKVVLITANGEIVENPRRFRRAERYLATCQQRVARRTKGSHRRRKAVAVLPRAHQSVKRQRADFHHKTALALLRANDTIYLEASRVANMARNLTSPRACMMRAGRGSGPSSTSRQYAPGVG
jgi:putative transposase